MVSQFWLGPPIDKLSPIFVASKLAWTRTVCTVFLGLKRGQHRHDITPIGQLVRLCLFAKTDKTKHYRSKTQNERACIKLKHITVVQ